MKDLEDLLGTYTDSEWQELEDHEICRSYTFTLKASHRQYKGNIQALSDILSTILTNINGRLEYYSVEDEGTSNLHLHAMIRCPYIVSKTSIRPLGWHTRFDIVQRKDEEHIDTIWNKYINKDKDTSTMIHLTYGNMFTTEE